MLSASESICTVLLFGVGPGLYFDLAGFIFQVPECVLAAAAGTFRASATSSSVVAKAANVLIRIIHSPWGVGQGFVSDFIDENSQKVQRVLVVPCGSCGFPPGLACEKFLD